MATSELEQVLDRLKRLERRVSQVERIEIPATSTTPTLTEAAGSPITLLQMMPGIAGLWPITTNASSVMLDGSIADLSGRGMLLVPQGNFQITYTLSVDSRVGHGFFDGTTAYLRALDGPGNSFEGNESMISGAMKGLTVGGWFRFDQLARVEGLITKYVTTTNNRTFRISKHTSDNIQFAVSSDGTSATQVVVTSAVGAVTTNQWYFIVGRFDPNTSIDLWINETKYTNTTGVPASLYNSTADLCIGAYSGGTSLLDGRASLCFITMSALTDELVGAIYESSRGFYG